MQGAAGQRERLSRACGAVSHIALRRFLSDEALLVHMKAVHSRSRGSYGLPRIWREPRNGGVRTYIATDEGRMYLAVVIDLISRLVVGWSMRADMTRDIVIDALRMAWFKRHRGKKAGLIFHSDRLKPPNTPIKTSETCSRTMASPPR